MVMKLPVPELLTFAQAAKRLGVSRQTIYNWVKDGKLVPILVAGKELLQVIDLAEMGTKLKDGDGNRTN